MSGKATAFTYDGQGRRVAISSTPAGGGSATVTSYLWCRESICQARNASNVTTRSYYDEGEYVPGTPGQPYYYGIDQIGSVRRAFASTSSAPAYSYDPYGVPLQATAPVTDFVYARMFYNADSGLYLTTYRAFDPISGRWLSRDPLNEPSDPSSNLYTYVAANPVNTIDPDGRWLRPQLPNISSLLQSLLPNSCAAPPGWQPRGIVPPGAIPNSSSMSGSDQPPTSPNIDPAEVTGKTPAEIDQIAKDKGLIPKGPDPMNGKGAYVDPETGKQRILIHPGDDAHAHVNDPSGQRLGPSGNVVAPESPEAHLPINTNP